VCKILPLHKSFSANEIFNKVFKAKNELGLTLVGWCNGDVWLPGGVDLCRSRARAVLSPSVIELSPSPLRNQNIYK
jgi:hypothetical protein